MVDYVVMCLLCCLTGLGVRRVLANKPENASGWTLAPGLGLSVWIVLLTLAVALGQPIGRAALPIAAISVILALLGLRSHRHVRNRAAIVGICIALVVPVAVMAAYFWYGISTYPGSDKADGWNYQAYAEYLKTMPAGGIAEMIPLYAYGIRISAARFAGSGLIALYSAFLREDTQAATGVFLAVSLFFYCSGCLSFSQMALRHRGYAPVFYAAFATCGGWMLNLIMANNFDNVLAAGFGPTLAGLAYRVDPRRPRWGVAAGLAAGAAILTYPELSPVLLFPATAVVVERMIREHWARKAWLLLLGVTLIVALLVGALWLNGWIAFFRIQLAAALSAGRRPGEGYYPALLDQHCALAAFWGFWSPVESCWAAIRDGTYYAGQALAVMLSLLAVIGAAAALRRGRWALPVTMLLNAAMAGYALLIWHYGYAASKIISAGWFTLAYLAFVGGETLWLARPRPRLLQSGLAGAAILSYATVSGMRVIKFDDMVAQKNIEYFAQVRNVAAIASNARIAVNLDDLLPLGWAVYYLRQAKTIVISHHPEFAPLSEAPASSRVSSKNLGDIRFQLVGPSGALCPEWRLVWEGGPYRLFKTSASGSPLLADLTTPNGLESWGFWMGGGDTEFTIVSREAGEADLSAYLGLGPSLPGRTDTRIAVLTDRGYRGDFTVGNGLFSFRVPIGAGATSIRLRPLDEPTLLKPPYADTRPLLIAVRGLSMLNCP